MVVINWDEVRDTASTLVSNIGEEAVCRSQEYAEAVIEQLIEWKVKYECKFAHSNNAGFYYSICAK